MNQSWCLRCNWPSIVLVRWFNSPNKGFIAWLCWIITTNKWHCQQWSSQITGYCVWLTLYTANVTNGSVHTTRSENVLIIVPLVSKINFSLRCMTHLIVQNQTASSNFKSGILISQWLDQRLMNREKDCIIISCIECTLQYNDVEEVATPLPRFVSFRYTWCIRAF